MSFATHVLKACSHAVRHSYRNPAYKPHLAYLNDDCDDDAIFQKVLDDIAPGLKAAETMCFRISCPGCRLCMQHLQFLALP